MPQVLQHCLFFARGQRARLDSDMRKDRRVHMPGRAFLLFSSLVLHARLAPFPRLPFTTAFASLFHCLHSLRSKCFALPGALRLFWTESALLSERPVSALLRTLLSCASALFIFGSNACTLWIIGTCLCMISGVCFLPELCLMNLRYR